MALADEQCAKIEKGTPPLSAAEARELAGDAPEWTLSEQAVERRFKFHDFREAMAFVNRVADLAEEQAHHPDIRISYNRVTLELSTHSVGGLSRNDFIMAAKVDRLA